MKFVRGQKHNIYNALVARYANDFPTSTFEVQAAWAKKVFEVIKTTHKVAKDSREWRFLLDGLGVSFGFPGAPQPVEPRRVYYIPPSAWVTDRGWQVAIVVEGETCYHPTDWFWDCDLKTAEKLAQERNDRLGVNKAEADRIVCRSMFPPVSRALALA